MRNVQCRQIFSALVNWTLLPQPPLSPHSIHTTFYILQCTMFNVVFPTQLNRNLPPQPPPSKTFCWAADASLDSRAPRSNCFWNPLSKASGLENLTTCRAQCTLPTLNVWGDIESLALSTHKNVSGRLKFPFIDGAVRLLDLFQIPDFNWWVLL